MQFVFDEDLRRAAEAIIELGSFDDNNYIDGDGDDDDDDDERSQMTGFSGFQALSNMGSTTLKTITSEISSKRLSSSSACHAVAATNAESFGGGLSMANRLAERVVFSLGSMLKADVQNSPTEDNDQQGFSALLAGLKKKKEKETDTEESETPAVESQQVLTTTTAGAEQDCSQEQQTEDEWDDW
jgi:hypothetical protein